jgi:hypothetical protein
MKKLIGSAAIALVLGSQAYAQYEDLPLCPRPFEQGTILSPEKYPPAYPAPARVKVLTSWDVFLTGSFLYWHADEEGLNLALSTTYSLDSEIPDDDFPAHINFPDHGEFLTQEYKYVTGFKCGLGFNFSSDNWVGLFEYTYFHMSTSNESTNPPESSHGGIPIWYATNWLETALTSISSKWRLNLDMVDATLSRPYYQGRKVTIQPFGGLRGAWIRQKLNLAGKLVISDVNVNSYSQSVSWAIGPRAGCKGYYLLGKGFRFEGNAAANLLYTYFTSVKFRNFDGSTAYPEFSLLMPSADMELGIGWGSYFDEDNYYFDVAASYSFNVMWGQNQMRALADETQERVGAAPGALHLHGLNATLRLDF